MQETQGLRDKSLGREDPLEKEMTTHSSILGWEIPWTEEPGGLQVHGGNKESDMTATKHARRCCEWIPYLEDLSAIFTHLK